MNKLTQKKFDYLNDTKDLIRDAIVSKGVEVSANATFRSYVDKIAEIGSSGGGTLPAGVYYEPIYIKASGTYAEVSVMMNGERYVFANGNSGASSIKNVYKMDDINHTKTIVATNDSTYSSDANICSYFVHNGKVHIAGYQDAKHIVYEGSTLKVCNTFPYNTSDQKSGNTFFVHDNKLKAYLARYGKVCVWDETADTWTDEATILSERAAAFFFNVNGVVYVINAANVYTYDGTALTAYDTLPIAMKSCSVMPFCKDGCIYFGLYENLTYGKVYKYDILNKEEKELGLNPFANNEFIGRFWEYNGRLAVQYSGNKNVTANNCYVNVIE